MMPPMSAFLLLLLAATIIIPSLRAAPPPPRGYYINCGSTKEETIGGIRWIRDDGFIATGNVSTIDTPNILPTLSTLRYFPETNARKYCYVIPVSKGAKYLVRTMYYYGVFDKGDQPPIFDQIVGGTKWSIVNTTDNYAQGLTSYYEIIVAAQAKTLSVCLARNEHTVSSPFISTLEVVSLEDSMYNSTDFTQYALSTVARHRFGSAGEIVSYPDDPFNRYWQPFNDTNPIVECHSNISSTDLWNIPPATALQHALTTSRGKELVVDWPPMNLPAASYYISLYFQDNRTPSPYSWRVFDVTVNGNTFYKGLNVSTDGVMVFGTHWPLSGETKIKMTPSADSPVGPVINAGEILQVVPIGGRTLTRDVIAMEEMGRRFENTPSDWHGDPCLPSENSWSGVTCSQQDNLVRVISLDLTNFGLSGTIPNCIANLTAVKSIWLSSNKLSGEIPDLSSLNDLKSLRLDGNQLTGPIPLSLGDLDKLKELFLQNNRLDAKLPKSLAKKDGIDIQL